MSKEQDLMNYFKAMDPAELDQLRGKPEAVLKAIDDYCNRIIHALKFSFFINVGDVKGQYILNEIKKKQPKLVVELGGYCGFSAIYFAQALAEGGKYYSFEISEEYAEIMRYFIDLAGLNDKIEVIVGAAGELLPKFAESHSQIDFVFIDHWKDLYAPDLRVLESLGLVGAGTLIAADNCKMPGAPGYLKYIQGDEDYKKSVCEEPNPSNKEYPGDPSLIYETRISEPMRLLYWLPFVTDQVAITTCTGKQ